MELEVSERLKELDLIQSCISRMSDDSLKMKGWSMAVFVAVLGLLPDHVSHLFIAFVGTVMGLLFWSLDASYLRLERLYRAKYQWVIMNRATDDRFLFDLDPANKEMRIFSLGQTEYESFRSAFWSKFVVGFHFFPILFYWIWFYIERRS